MPVPTGVADVLIRPPLALQTPIRDEHGPYSAGNHTITNFLTTTTHGLLPAGTWPIGGTYGVIAAVSGSIPVTWGYDLGWDNGGSFPWDGLEFENRFCQLVIMHQVLGGAFVVIQRENCHFIQTYIPMIWIPLGGDQIGLNVSPAISIDLFFMCLLA